MTAPYRRPPDPYSRHQPAQPSAPANPTSPVQQDYSALLASDPILHAATVGIETRGVQQQLGLTAARQQALIGYGGDLGNIDPALAGNVGADITDSTRQLAGQATEAGLSTVARLRDQYRRNQSADIGSLGGRGLIRSGAYRQHSRENLQGYQTASADAAQATLGQLAGLWQGYQGDQAENAAGIQGARSDALARIAAGIGAGEYGAGGASSQPPAAGRPAATPPPAAMFYPGGAPTATAKRPAKKPAAASSALARVLRFG